MNKTCVNGNTGMQINMAKTVTEIAACYPVMRELRPHISRESFVECIRDQQSQGYKLAYIEVDGAPVAVAGFRIGQNLAWGSFLYVDDLVALASHRSRGYGAHLLAWLNEQAVKEGCDQLHLDSGMHRKDAHRFYEREGLQAASLHFVRKLKDS